MESKTDQIKALLAGEQYVPALRIASKFFDRSQDTSLFKTAWEANQSPDLWRQIGKDPEALLAKAVARMKERFMN